MSKTSAIQHPPKDRFVMIRASYLALCEGDHCAAAILHEAEHWYNYRLANSNQATQENERAQQNDETPSQVTDLWFYMTVEDWQSTALLGAFSERKVQAALTWLVDNEYLFRRNNPKYAWDRTFQYLLNVVKVQECITSKCGNGSAQNEASNTTVHEQNTEEDSNTTPVAKSATGEAASSKNGNALPQVPPGDWQPANVFEFVLEKLYAVQYNPVNKISRSTRGHVNTIRATLKDIDATVEELGAAWTAYPENLSKPRAPDAWAGMVIRFRENGAGMSPVPEFD